MMVASLVGPDTPTSAPMIDQMIGDDAVERSEHLGIAEVDFGELDRRLGVENIGGGLVGLRFPFLRRGLAGEILPGERRLPLIFRLVVGLRRLIGGERRLGLIELGLIDVAFDAEQLGSLGDGGAVRIVDRFEVALHACYEIDGVDRLRCCRSARDIA